MSKLINTEALSTFYEGITNAIKDEESRAKAVEESLQTAIDGKSDDDHMHNDIYYTKTEIDTGLKNYYTRATIDSIVSQMDSEVTASLANKSDTGHTHNDIYYTKTEIDAGLQDYYTSEQVDGLFASAESEITTALTTKLDTSVAVEHFVQTSLVTAPEEVDFEIHSLYKNETLISPLVNMYSVIDTDGVELPTYISYFEQQIGAVNASLGDGTQLLTDAKDTVVAAINEVQTEINNLDSELDKLQPITDNSLETEAKTVPEAINEVNANAYSLWTTVSQMIGDSSQLTTTAKDSIVNCINELQTEINTHNHNDSYYTKTEIDTKESNFSGAIADEESRAKAEEQVLSERIDTLSSDKADAIALNNYQLITDDTLQTANKTIPNAINELQGKITDEESRAKAEEQALSRSIDTINSNKADATALNSYQLITDNTLETANKTIPNAINELKTSIDSNKSDADTKFNNVNTSIANIESKNNTQDSEITTLKSDVASLDSRLGGVTIKQLTQAQYDALATKDANTLYVIVQ